MLLGGGGAVAAAGCVFAEEGKPLTHLPQIRRASCMEKRAARSRKARAGPRREQGPSHPMELVRVGGGLGVEGE